MPFSNRIIFMAALFYVLSACATGGPPVSITRGAGDGVNIEGIGDEELAQLAEIQKELDKKSGPDSGLKNVINSTPNYTVQEYLALHPDAGNEAVQDYRVGGYDVLDIRVYEEDDLNRPFLRVSADGYISFPLIGRVKVDGLATSEIEKLISNKLADGQFMLDAHVSVTVAEFNSKQFMVLGSVNKPGTYPLQADEGVLDAISRAGGIDFEQGGKDGMLIRTENPNTSREEKIVIRIELSDLLKGGDQVSNLLLADKDLLYIPKAEFYYVIGQVRNPGKYPYLQKEVTIVEAISSAGGFTPIAARNRTRIIRLANGVEEIIQVKVDAITDAGKKLHDIKIVPGDVIVVPESFF